MNASFANIGKSLLVLGGLGLAPLLVESTFLRHLLVLWMIFALLALSLNLLMGYIGEISFGHAAFFGLGAYASALFALNLGVPFWGGVIVAALVSGVVGLALGAIALRIKGPQFTILTLAMGAILQQIANHWIDLTRGPMGLTKIPPPNISIPGVPLIDFGRELPFYYLSLGAVLLTVLLTKRLLGSRTGRAFLAVRENDALAAAVGVDVFRTKLVGFGISTALAGVGGSFYAHYFKVITPELFGLHYVAAMIVMVVIGGKGTVAGPILGAFVYVGLLEWLRVAGSLRMVFFGGLLAACVIFMPGGLVGFWNDRLAPRLFGRRDAIPRATAPQQRQSP